MFLTENDKARAHFLMILLVFLWGLEYVAAKWALESVATLTLVCFKYMLAILVIGPIKLKMDRRSFFRKKDIPLFFVCALFGEILYFFCEYEAMDYMPVSLITVILAFVPAASIMTEKLLFKRDPTLAMVAGIFICIFGIIMVIGADIGILFEGRFAGYLFCFGAVLSWNTYNFMTAHLKERYSAITLTFNQLVCTILLSLPFALSDLPKPEDITMPVLGGMLFLGFISAGAGFLVYVYALGVLGPTTMSVYSNFLPVTATLFGWILLGEMIGGVQLLGGIIVISAGYLVIKEKAKVDKKRLEVLCDDRET